MHGTFTHSHSHVTSHHFLWISLQHGSTGGGCAVGAPPPPLMLPLYETQNQGRFAIGARLLGCIFVYLSRYLLTITIIIVQMINCQQYTET